MKGKILKKIGTLTLSLSLLTPSLLAHAANESSDAVYREGGFLNSLGHAGVYKGSGYVYHIAGPWHQVEVVPLTTFIDGKTFYGYFYNTSMDSYDRLNIQDTLWLLDQDPDITYTASGQLYHESNAGSYISVDEITDIRCDGVVEYSYEWNNIWVWGRSDTGTSNGTPTHFDISNVSYTDEHNDLGEDEPWIEVSPDVQRGASGTKWTQLTVH
jgi:hypothetical protein